MVFGAKSGERMSDLAWDIAVGRRCAQCHAKLADGHTCRPSVERTSSKGGVIHTPTGLDIPFILEDDKSDDSV